MQLLEAMHNENNDAEAGRITLMPLNQLERKLAARLTEEPFENRDAKPIIRRLRYDAKFAPAMQQVILNTIYLLLFLTV
jgi:chromosome segregation ATPase